MVKYGIFRGDKLVGRVIFSDLNQANKEKEEWNKQFSEFNDYVKANKMKKDLVEMVEVKEYRAKRRTVKQRLRELM